MPRTHYNQKLSFELRSSPETLKTHASSLIYPAAVFPSDKIIHYWQHFYWIFGEIQHLLWDIHISFCLQPDWVTDKSTLSLMLANMINLQVWTSFLLCVKLAMSGSYQAFILNQCGCSRLVYYLIPRLWVVKRLLILSFFGELISTKCVCANVLACMKWSYVCSAVQTAEEWESSDILNVCPCLRFGLTGLISHCTLICSPSSSVIPKYCPYCPFADLCPCSVAVSLVDLRRTRMHWSWKNEPPKEHASVCFYSYSM